MLYVLAGPHMLLHGNSLCSCSLYMAAHSAHVSLSVNENVDDPSRDLKIQNALAGQPSQGLKDKMP